MSDVRKRGKHRHHKSQCNCRHTPRRAQILKLPVQRAEQILCSLAFALSTYGALPIWSGKSVSVIVPCSRDLALQDVLDNTT